MALDDFWAGVEAMLKDVAERATDADKLVEVMNKWCSPSSGDAFFPGGGGDDTLQEALETAGWRMVWADAWYYYVMKAPDGSLMTYVEGDVFKGDKSVRPTEGA